MGSTRRIESTKGKTMPMRKRKSKKKTVRKIRLKGKLARILSIFFASLYLVALWNWVFHGGIETGILHTGLLELKVPAEGVFIRDETWIQAAKEGIVIPQVNQGQRVPNQFQIAILIDSRGSKTLDRIESMEREIIRRSMEETPYHLDDDPVFRAKVQNEVNKLTNHALGRGQGSLSHIRTALERLLYQRNKELFREQDERLYLQKEKQELEQMKKSLDENAMSISADYSGLIVWDTDAADEKYDIDNIGNLLSDDLVYNPKEQSGLEIHYIGIDEAFSVEKNQQFVRLVNNEKSWFVCVVDNKKAEQIRLKDNLHLKVEGLDVTIPCKVESVKSLGQKTRVTVSFTRLVEETIHLRHARAELILESVRGIKVPLRSLINKNSNDNTADIFIVRFNRTKVKRVKILAEQDSFAVIEAAANVNETDPARIFDVYVVDPRNIEEGQVIEQ